MRRRFFLTILASVALTTLSVSIVLFYFFRTERLRLIDLHLQTVASALLSSDLSSSEFEDVEAAEQFIANAIGDEMNTALIQLLTPNGDVFYRNRAAHLLPVNVGSPERWQTIKNKGHLFRLFSLPLTEEGWVVQVGLLLDRGQIEWRTLSLSALGYVFLIVIVILAASYVLTAVLFRPVRALAAYLRHLTETTAISEALSTGGAPLSQSNDEMGQLVRAVDEFSMRMRNHLQNTQRWTSMMAHELKTPLTIIRNQIETVRRKGLSNSEELVCASAEIDQLGQTIQSFLEWARLESTKGESLAIHAIKLPAQVQKIVERMNPLWNNRIQFRTGSEMTIFGNPELVTQLVTNLLSNALRYSPQTRSVEVFVDGEQMIIQDHGPGVPSEVLSKLGQPFNSIDLDIHPTAPKGTGLGLAWVKSICRTYGWDFRLDSFKSGTKSQVVFHAPQQ